MISDCGNYSMVVIFYCGFPFSTKYNNAVRNYPDISSDIKLCAADFPAVTFCLYKKNKKLVNIHKIFGKDKIKSDVDFVKIDNNLLKTVIEKGIHKYFLSINLDFPYRNLKLLSEIEVKKIKCSPFDDLHSEFDENHFWSPESPECYVKAEINIGNKKLSFQGTGYSDRNYGTAPVFHNIKEWFWGRFHSKTFNIIYYHINYINHEPLKMLLLIDKNGKTEMYKNLEVKFLRKFNYFFLNYFYRINISSQDFKIAIFNNAKIENGPFYIRFLSDFNITYKGFDLSGKGITEYISPQRLRCRFLYPFINLKIKND
jgi:hypothetical protein